MERVRIDLRGRDWSYCFTVRSNSDYIFRASIKNEMSRDYVVTFVSFEERMNERENVREALTAIDLGLTDC